MLHIELKNKSLLIPSPLSKLKEMNYSDHVPLNIKLYNGIKIYSQNILFQCHEKGYQNKSYSNNPFNIREDNIHYDIRAKVQLESESIQNSDIICVQEMDSKKQFSLVQNIQYSSNSFNNGGSVIFYKNNNKNINNFKDITNTQNSFQGMKSNYIQEIKKILPNKIDITPLEKERITIATIKSDEEDILLFNLHGGGDFNNKKKEEQNKLEEFFLNLMKNGKKIIVTGDWNIKEPLNDKLKKYLVNYKKDEYTSIANEDSQNKSINNLKLEKNDLVVSNVPLELTFKAIDSLNAKDGKDIIINYKNVEYKFAPLFDVRSNSKNSSLDKKVLFRKEDTKAEELENYLKDIDGIQNLIFDKLKEKYNIEIEDKYRQDILRFIYQTAKELGGLSNKKQQLQKIDFSNVLKKWKFSNNKNNFIKFMLEFSVCLQKEFKEKKFFTARNDNNLKKIVGLRTKYMLEINDLIQVRKTPNNSLYKEYNKEISSEKVVNLFKKDYNFIKQSNR